MARSVLCHVMGVGPPGSPCRRRFQTTAGCGDRSSTSAGPWTASAAGQRLAVAGRVCDREDAMCGQTAAGASKRNRALTRASKLGSVAGWSHCADKGPLRLGPQSGSCLYVAPGRCPVYRWRELVAGAGQNSLREPVRAPIETARVFGREPPRENALWQASAMVRLRFDERRSTTPRAAEPGHRPDADPAASVVRGDRPVTRPRVGAKPAGPAQFTVVCEVNPSGEDTDRSDPRHHLRISTRTPDCGSRMTGDCHVRF